jgi:hypothetical protein
MPGKPLRSAEIHLIGGHGHLVARTARDGSFAFPTFAANSYQVVVVLHSRAVTNPKALDLRADRPPVRLRLSPGGRLMVFQSK